MVEKGNTTNPLSPARDDIMVEKGNTTNPLSPARDAIMVGKITSPPDNLNI